MELDPPGSWSSWRARLILLEDLERLPAPPFFAVADMVHSLVPRVGLELLLAEARSSRVLEFLACLTDPLRISSDYLRLTSCHLLLVRLSFGDKALHPLRLQE